MKPINIPEKKKTDKICIICMVLRTRDAANGLSPAHCTTNMEHDVPDCTNNFRKLTDVQLFSTQLFENHGEKRSIEWFLRYREKCISIPH